MADFSGVRHATIFATPLLTYVWERAWELNPSLRAQILAHEAEHQGVGKSNQGGWHSETGELEFCGEPGRLLVAYMREFADEATKRVARTEGKEVPAGGWRVSAWANVNRRGDFNKVHVHPESTWSGTYYVETGKPSGERGAPLHLHDPCQGRSTTFAALVAPSVYIHPKPGLMVLFPSYVPHMVFPHDDDGTRISIAFNLRREPKP